MEKNKKNKNSKQFLFKPRPLLMDHIQLRMRPAYYEIYQKSDKPMEFYNYPYDEYPSKLIEIRKQKKYKNVQNRKSGKHKYEIMIPSKYPFISDIRLSAWGMFDMSFKFNFIRYLNCFLQEINAPGYDKEYFEKIKLDDDNFITYNVWPYDNSIVRPLVANLQDNVLRYANNIFSEFTNGSLSMEYQKATVSHLEINHDFFVGQNQSMIIMQLLHQYLTDFKNEISFRKKLGAIAMHHGIPYSLDKKNKTLFNKNETLGIYFPICDGFSFHIYKKTTEDIRTEFTYLSDFMIKKFKTPKMKFDKQNGYYKEIQSGSRDLSRIIAPAFKFTKKMFADLNFANYLLHSVYIPNQKTSIDYSRSFQNLCFETYPELNHVQNALLNNIPIKDPRIISSIRENFPKFLKKFDYKTIKGVKSLVLRETPKKTVPSKKRRIPYKTDKAPKNPKPVLKYIFLKPGEYQTGLGNEIYIADTEPVPLTTLKRNFRSGSKLREKNTNS